jgi:hypothetical protein
MSNFEIAIKEYNKRILKITQDLFSLTLNSNFQRFNEFIQHEIEVGSDITFIWKHIEHSQPRYYTRIVVQNDQNIFQDPYEQFNNDLDSNILTELRQCWGQLSNKEKKIIFECIQNIFKIAKYVEDNHYSELIQRLA